MCYINLHSIRLTQIGDKLSHVNTRDSGGGQVDHDRTGKMSSRKSQEIGISWDEVEEAAEDRRSWRNRVVQCVFDAG